MWHLKRKQDKQENKNWKDDAAKKIADKIIRFREWLVRLLERFDKRLNATQRKVVFYLCMLIWSCCMFYILGNAIRQQPAPFVVPLYDAADIQQRMQFDSILNLNKNYIISQHKKASNGKNRTN